MGLFGNKKNKEQEEYQRQQEYQQQQQQPSRWQQAAHAAEQQTGHNGGSRYTYGQDQDWDEEPEDYNSSEWLDYKTKRVQNESVESSRRALQRMRETERLGQQNMNTLANQSEQLANAERRLGAADHHVSMSETKTDEIKALNRFFMLPTFGAEKRSKKKQEKLQREHEEQQRQYDANGDSVRQRGDRLRNGGGNGGPNIQPRGGSRHYTTPQGLERCDVEAEIDNNLDEISSGLSRIKMMGMAMNSELDSQDTQIRNIHDKTSRTDERVGRATGKLNALTKGKK